MSAQDRGGSVGLEAAVAGAVQAAPERIVSAYLFGGQAEGRSHAESDIDLGILLPLDKRAADRERFDLRVRITSWLNGHLHRDDIDMVILNDAPPQFGRRIVTAGRRVFCSDAAADHAFVRDVQLRAADLEPFLRRTRGSSWPRSPGDLPRRTARPAPSTPGPTGWSTPTGNEPGRARTGPLPPQ